MNTHLRNLIRELKDLGWEYLPTQTNGAPHFVHPKFGKVVVASTPADWEDECRYTLQRIRKVTKRYADEQNARTAKSVPSTTAQPTAASELDLVMAQIVEAEHELEQIEQTLPRIANEYHATMDPLLEKMVEQRREVLRGLGSELCNPTWRKKQINQIADLCLTIRDLTQERFSVSLADELKFLDVLRIEKEQAQEEHREQMGEPAEFDRVLDGFDEQDWERWFDHYESNPTYHPSEKSQAHSKQKASENHQARKSQHEPLHESPQALSRKLYLNLARELHPDKTTDAIEREQRTHLMQKVNAAYEKGDLRSLLYLLQVHGTNISRDSLDLQTEAMLKQNLTGQLDAIRVKAAKLLQDLPCIDGNWRAILTQPNLWEAYLRKERRNADHEIVRFSHVQRELKQRLAAFLRDTNLDDWEELF